MPKRLKFGDIIEIPTSKGLAYAQFIHRHEQFGVMIRVLEGFFKSRPDNFKEIVMRKHRFITFSPIQNSVNRGIFSIVGNEEIPEDSRSFPIFRGGGLRDRKGKIDNWWLWDGEKELRIGKLSPEQRYLPIHQLMTETYLIMSIEEGWRPEKDISTV